jgi:hypothetical protein
MVPRSPKSGAANSRARHAYESEPFPRFAPPAEDFSWYSRGRRADPLKSYGSRARVFKEHATTGMVDISWSAHGDGDLRDHTCSTEGRDAALHRPLDEHSVLFYRHHGVRRGSGK